VNNRIGEDKRRPTTLRNEMLHSLYFLPNIVRVVKSRRMGWARHVARMETKHAYRILDIKPKGKRSLGSQGH
jgi:hypothetical protein